jgi:hypothetical protein
MQVGVVGQRAFCAALLNQVEHALCSGNCVWILQTAACLLSALCLVADLA